MTASSNSGAICALLTSIDVVMNATIITRRKSHPPSHDGRELIVR